MVDRMGCRIGYPVIMASGALLRWAMPWPHRRCMDGLVAGRISQTGRASTSRRGRAGILSTRRTNHGGGANAMEYATGLPTDVGLYFCEVSYGPDMAVLSLDWLPKVFDARYHLSQSHIGLPLIIVYNICCGQHWRRLAAGTIFRIGNDDGEGRSTADVALRFTGVTDFSGESRFLGVDGGCASEHYGRGASRRFCEPVHDRSGPCSPRARLARWLELALLLEPPGRVLFRSVPGGFCY